MRAAGERQLDLLGVVGHEHPVHAPPAVPEDPERPIDPDDPEQSDCEPFWTRGRAGDGFESIEGDGIRHQVPDDGYLFGSNHESGWMKEVTKQEYRSEYKRKQECCRVVESC